MKFLFDLGGVFFDWDPKNFYKNIFTDENELNFFLNEVCNDAWNLKQDCGRKINDAYLELINKFPNYEEQIKMYYSNHRKMINGIFPDSISILNKLKNLNYSCYVLSNWSAETFKGMINEYPFLKIFDGMVISGEEMLVKPDPLIYYLAIKKFNLYPSSTIFIDDKLENILAAKNIGFNTIHLTNPDSIKSDIENFINI